MARFLCRSSHRYGQLNLVMRRSLSAEPVFSLSHQLSRSSPRFLSTSLPRMTTEDEATDNVEPIAEAPEPEVLIEKMESLHIMTIGINRPDKRNCVNTTTSEELKLAFQDFEEDDNMYCCVFHGLGGNFCAGYDLDELADLKDEGHFANKIAEILMDQGPMGPTRMELSKPVIAAVNGYCVAGGLELALMCDLRVVEENSKMGFLNRRFGVPLIDGGTVRLTALIGVSRAMDLILTGRMIEAKEAHEMGLANRVVSTGTGYGQAVNLAKELVKFPQACLRADRASAIHSTYSGKTVEDDMSFESQNAAHVLTTEAVAGAKKFMSGMGRSGKFNVNAIAPPEDWQKEFSEMKKKNDAEKNTAQDEKT